MTFDAWQFGLRPLDKDVPGFFFSGSIFLNDFLKMGLQV